jgi:hypothetical protein
MSEKYESGQGRSEHAEGKALADFPSALHGKLSSGLDAPHTAAGGKCSEGCLVIARR